MFKFFSGKSKEKEIIENRKKKESVYEQILNLFSIDIEKLPDTNCEFIKRDDSDSENHIKYFYKRELEEKQLLLFDQLEFIHLKIVENLKTNCLELILNEQIVKFYILRMIETK